MIALIQRVFFGGLMMKPRPEWIEELRQFGGTVTPRRLTRRGRTVAAAIISRGTPARGICIFVHPMTRRAKYYFAKSKATGMYLDRGFDVGVFDFNGFGESDSIDFKYWRDVECAISALTQGYSRVVLHGMSFGAYHMVRAIPSLPPASTVVLENVNRSLADYWRRYPVALALIRVALLLKVQSFVDMDIKSALRENGRLDLRFYAVACGNDIVTPATEMADLLSNFRGTVTMFEFAHAAHLEAPEGDFSKYSELVDAATSPVPHNSSTR